MGRYFAYFTVPGTNGADGEAELAARVGTCRSYAERNQAVLFKVFTDEEGAGVCGLENRPALLDAIRELGRGDFLVVPGRDVLEGDPIAAAIVEGAIMKKGARIVRVAAEETRGSMPSNGLKCQVMAALSDYERLMAGIGKGDTLHPVRERRGLIEIRKQLWQSSWTSLAETVKRPDDDGGRPCDEGEEAG